MRRGLLALVAAGLVCGGCSLPLSDAVQPVGEVPAEQPLAAPLQVIPPGPHAGASPAATVLGFLGAQASSDNRHAIAREYLAPTARGSWDDREQVLVYDPAQLVVRALPGATSRHAEVRVSSVVVGAVHQDGSYEARTRKHVAEDYVLDRTGGEWRLSRVPAGLRLTPADRERSFRASAVYYLVATGETPHVIPDRYLLPVGQDPASALVRRLLMPPSAALAGSVETAVPKGSRLRQDVRLSSSGIATVDLTGFAQPPRAAAAQNLSAQLVWTLRSLGSSFKGLRLLADGQVLPVPGQGAVQDPGAWDAFDPDGIGRNLPYYYVVDRRLRSSDDLPPGPLVSGTPGEGPALGVDRVAVTPDRRRVAVLSSERGGDVLRVGALGGSTFRVAVRAPRLRFPSWGSGLNGLYLLRGDREVLRVTDAGVQVVRVSGLPAGPVTALSASRDGVRIAAAVSGRLYAGRVSVSAAGAVASRFTEVLPGLTDVSVASWATSSEVVVLGRLTHPHQVVRLAVDGSRASVVDTSGLLPTDVSASAAGILVVSGTRLQLSTGGAFSRIDAARATAPAFPG